MTICLWALWAVWVWPFRLARDWPFGFRCNRFGLSQIDQELLPFWLRYFYCCHYGNDNGWTACFGTEAEQYRNEIELGLSGYQTTQKRSTRSKGPFWVNLRLVQKCHTFCCVSRGDRTRTGSGLGGLGGLGSLFSVARNSSLLRTILNNQNFFNFFPNHYPNDPRIAF